MHSHPELSCASLLPGRTLPINRLLLLICVSGSLFARRHAVLLLHSFGIAVDIQYDQLIPEAYTKSVDLEVPGGAVRTLSQLFGMVWYLWQRWLIMRTSPLRFSRQRSPAHTMPS